MTGPEDSDPLERALRAARDACGPPARIEALHELLRLARRELDGLRVESRGGSGAEALRALFVGREETYRQLVGQIGRVAGTDLPVLVEGPPGSGRSLVALCIHHTGARRTGPLERVDGPGLDALAAAWSAAAGGSLLLTDLEATSPAVQLDLLERLKAADPQDPRLLVCSRDLDAGAREGWVQEPLRDRLRVLRIRLLALRAKPEAIPSLFGSVLREEGGEASPEIEPAAERALVRHPWPENVRELRAVARALLKTPREVVRRSDLEPLLIRPAPRASSADDAQLPLEDLEREIIARRLAQLDWHQQRTAESLGIDRKTLYRKIRRYGLSPPEP